MYCDVDERGYLQSGIFGKIAVSVITSVPAFNNDMNILLDFDDFDHFLLTLGIHQMR